MTMVTNEPKVNTCQCGQEPYMRWLANNCRQLCCGTCGRRGVIGETAEVAAADWNRQTAAPDLLAACEQKNRLKSLPDYLDWIGDRLSEVYGESPNVDFVLGCHERADILRAAIANARQRRHMLRHQYKMKGGY